jgi:(2Fe-2S) ferredoxin
MHLHSPGRVGGSSIQYPASDRILWNIQDPVRVEFIDEQRKGVTMPRPEKHVFVCLNTRPPGHPKGSCTERGAESLLPEFARLMEAREAYGKIAITRTSCLGPCELGPNVLVYPDGVMYVGVRVGDVEEIFDQHLLGNNPVSRLRAPAEIWE